METEDLKALEERTTFLYEWVESNDTIFIVEKLLELDDLKKEVSKLKMENDMLRKDIQSFINDFKKLNKDKN